MTTLEGVLGKFFVQLQLVTLIACMTCIAYLLMCLYIWQCRTDEQKLNHKCAMIHSKDVNVLDKNYNLFCSAKGLPFKFILTFFNVSTIKSFMRSPSWCYAC